MIIFKIEDTIIGHKIDHIKPCIITNKNAFKRYIIKYKGSINQLQKNSTLKRVTIQKIINQDKNLYMIQKRVLFKKSIKKQSTSGYFTISHNNSYDNLFLCNGNSEHLKIHKNLEKLAARLIKAGVITFCPEIKEYLYIHTFLEDSNFLKELY